MQKEPTFAERTALMKQVSLDLVKLSDLVADETERMEAVQARFAEKRSTQKPRH